MRRFLLFAASLMLAAPLASAQVQPLGAEFQVNTYTTDVQSLPEAAADSSGNFVVTWESYYQDGDRRGVFAQRYDAAGNRRGAEFQVNTVTVRDQGSPAVASDPAGNFMVVWNHREYPIDPIVKAQRFDAAGAPVGAETLVSLGGYPHIAPRVASDPAGEMMVVWQKSDLNAKRILGQRFDASGTPTGPNFEINSRPLSGYPDLPDVASDGTGRFVVVWSDSAGGGYGDGVFLRRYDPVAGPVPPLQANSCPGIRHRPAVAALGTGKAVVSWVHLTPNSIQIEAQVFGPRGPIGREIVVGPTPFLNIAALVVVSDGPDRFVVLWEGPGGNVGRGFNADGVPITEPFPMSGVSPPVRAASLAPGTFVTTWTDVDGSWQGIFGRRFGGLGTVLEPHHMAVDTGGNGVFESGETVPVQAGWKNPTAAPITLTGTATAFTGPAGATYTIVDGAAQYSIPAGQSGDCGTTGNCYSFAVSAPSRPAPHWDATVQETLSGGVSRSWSLHFGDSFADVTRVQGFYRFVETLLHHGVTGGCAANSYCPNAPILRQEMAVYLRVAREGQGCPPNPCIAGAETFGDVPESSVYCRWIEEMARFGISTGCAPGLFCPLAQVTREQLAVFVLTAREGPGYAPPACVAGSEVFSDVPAASGFCRWIEELARRQVVSGCGGGRFCPANTVTRGDMAVFVSVTFGLSLYGP